MTIDTKVNCESCIAKIQEDMNQLIGKEKLLDLMCQSCKNDNNIINCINCLASIALNMSMV